MRSLVVLTSNAHDGGTIHSVSCCRGSLDRLSVAQIGLYQIHWPGFLTQAFSNDAFVKGLAQCASKGLTKAVGVSNFKADRVRRAASILEVRFCIQDVILQKRNYQNS